MILDKEGQAEIYAYDRGLDIDSAPAGLLDAVIIDVLKTA